MNAIIPYLPDLVLVFAAFTIAAGSPGPSTLAIMSTAMGAGRTPALALAAGIISGSFTWGLLAAAGVTALIASHSGALYAVKIAGGLYLLYLAWRAARSSMRPDVVVISTQLPESHDLNRIYVRGYLMHLTNPKAILGWTAIIALGLPPNPPWQVIVAILAGCLLISAVLNCGYALAFSTAPMVNGYRRARRWIEGALAGLFAFAGIKLLTTRF
jgi:threonine efflux protein